jgi:hypothetical protein
LQRRCANLIFSNRRFEIKKRLDIPAHKISPAHILTLASRIDRSP